jgi:hypothetical protein
MGQEAPCRGPDHPRVQAEPLAAELGPQPDIARDFERLGLERKVPEGVAARTALRGQAVQIARRSQFDGLQVQLGRGPADDEGQVVGRAGRSTQGLHLGAHELGQGLRVQDRRGFLEKKRLIRGSSALGDEEKPVLAPAGGVDLDLGRQVAGGVFLRVHGQVRILGIAQVALGEGVETPRTEPLVTVAAETRCPSSG